MLDLHIEKINILHLSALKIICFLSSLAFFFGCQENAKYPEMHFEGKTMGTSYHITIYDPSSNANKEQSLKISVDSLLYWINLGISTYEKNSLVTFFNQSRSHQIVFPVNDTTPGALDHFFTNLSVAHQTFKTSHGFFDPTVMKLVNYWGFGYSGRVKVQNPDTAILMTILKSTGMDKVNYQYDKVSHQYELYKSDSLIELDFGGIGQGYGADMIAQFLDHRGYNSFLAEVGGEMVARGTKPDGKKWTVGLNTPLESAATDDIFSKVALQDEAITTSGNYRNFYTSGAETYSHTMNPKTGFPQRSTLLSVTLIGSDCTSIDAMATACMTVGMDSCTAILLRQSIEAYYIYRAGDSLQVDMTPGFKQYLVPE